MWSRRGWMLMVRLAPLAPQAPPARPELLILPLLLLLSLLVLRRCNDTTGLSLGAPSFEICSSPRGASEDSVGRKIAWVRLTRGFRWV